MNYFCGKATGSHVSRVDALSNLENNKYIVLLRFKSWVEGHDAKIQMKTLDWALEQFGQRKLSDRVRSVFSEEVLNSKNMKRKDLLDILKVNKGKLSRLMNDENESLPFVDTCLPLCDEFDIKVIDSSLEEKKIAPLKPEIQILKLEVEKSKVEDKLKEMEGRYDELKDLYNELAIENQKLRKKLEKKS